MANIDSKLPYILWIDYGTEGWSPRSFLTVQEALDEIQSGCYGQDFQITKLLKLSITEPT